MNKHFQEFISLIVYVTANVLRLHKQLKRYIITIKTYLCFKVCLLNKNQIRYTSASNLYNSISEF